MRGRSQKPKLRKRPLVDDLKWLDDIAKVHELLLNRDAKVASWILSLRLPAVPGVDWTRVTSAVKTVAHFRSKEARDSLAIQISILRDAKPFDQIIDKPEPERPTVQRKRSKKGEVPIWFERASRLCKQTEGQMRDSSIAKELKLSPSTLSRSKLWKALRTKFDKKPPTVAENLRNAARGARVSPEELLLGERSRRNS